MNVTNRLSQAEYWVLSFSGGKDSTALGLDWMKLFTATPEWSFRQW